MPSGATHSVGYADTSAAFSISSNPVVGVFIYRSADDPSGTFTANNVSLSWNYAQDGVQNTNTVEVRVFAIEMVYIPTGSFFAGDNATSYASFMQGSSDNDPWYIGSEAAISVGSQAGTGTGFGEVNSEYYYVTDAYTYDEATGASFTVPAAFPKGYNKFYMMKGEVSQGQWVSFFNTLTTTQKNARDITAASGKNRDTVYYRNNISWISGDANLPDQGVGALYESVAMSYLSWADLVAYLDWAGLRPASELEFERAGRGPYRALSGEYAWGNTSVTGATTVTDAGKSSEVGQSDANCVYNNGVQGPMRVGSMSYGKATRVESGAGYYGNMDLSGNISERLVTVGNSEGRGFEGSKHGNGMLTSAGDANVTTWPGTAGTGAGLHGAAWNMATNDLALSSRTYAAVPNLAGRSFNRGGRGVRTAP